jgi:8-amino-7-oxononanoate synthase
MSSPGAGYLARIEAMLDEIRAQHRYREITSAQLPPETIDFSSNDYLGMAVEPQVVAALQHATRAGSGGARLLSGRHREHSLLEEELALWLGRERVLLFSSGYHAALGAVPVLADATGTIFSDERNHASLIDGVRLTHAPRVVYPHGKPPIQTGARGDGGALVVTESIFSMDGDTVDPRAVLAGLGPDDVLLVDEAHALGVAGPEGAGLAHGLADPRVVVIGTLSKALGAHGGFVAGPARVIELLVNRARTFVFDTALPPAIALAARVALILVRRAGDRRARLLGNVARMRDGLRALGLLEDERAWISPIVPLVLGSEERALTVAARLLERRIYAPAIRPPTVPPGSSRLRFSIRAGHAPEHVELVLGELRRCIATS